MPKLKHPQFIADLIKRRDELKAQEEHRLALENLSRSYSSTKPIGKGVRLPKPESDTTSDFLAVLNGDL